MSNDVKQSEVQLLPSEPCIIAAVAPGAAKYDLLPELQPDVLPDIQLFRPYLESLPEEDQMAIALRLNMEHMRDIYIIDRTIGYSNWAKTHPAEHLQIMAAKPTHQKLVLPPMLNVVLAMLPVAES